MSPPPPLDVRVTVSSLALVALACGGEAQSRPDQSSGAQPTAPDGAPLEPPRREASSPASGAAPPRGEAGDPMGLAGQLDQRDCPIGSLVARGTPADEMAAFEVRHADFARRTLYSWTTAEQARELREDFVLLTRAATAEGEPGRAAEVIREHAGSDPLAALLDAPRFENKRFGWSNAWATVQGFGGERYGDHLLRITLREQAWVGRLIVSLDGRLDWAFADVRGNPVPATDVLASPERLAAVYFVDLRGAGCGTLNYIGSAFREYFVCNEDMLESFELYTGDVRAELDRSINALSGLRQALLEGSCASLEYCWPDAALAEWGASGAAEPPLGVRYLAALAFPSEEYAPTPANVAELLRRLLEVPFDAPLFYRYP